MFRTIFSSIVIMVGMSERPLASERPRFEGLSYAQYTTQQLSAQRRAESDVSVLRENAALLAEVLDRYRMLVEAMLNRGDRLGGETGSRLIVHASRMIQAESSIQQLLQPFVDDELPLELEAQIQAELHRFKQGIRAGLARIPMREDSNPEHAVMGLLGPLRRACEMSSGTQAGCGWWPSEQSEKRGTYSKQRDLASVFHEIEVEESLRSLLSELPGDSRLFQCSVSLVVDLDSCSWMNGPARKSIKQTLLAEVQRARLSQQDMVEASERIEAMDEMIVSMIQLAEAPGGRSVATRRSEVFEELLEVWPGQFIPASTALSIAETIDILARTRAMEDEELSRFRSRVYSGLKRQRLLAETRAFDSFCEIAASTEPWTEPGLVVILSEPRHLLVAMQRLQQLESWSDSIQQMSPESAPALIERLEVLVGAMADVRTREDSTRALNEFERQLELFLELMDQCEFTDDRFNSGQLLKRLVKSAHVRWVEEWSNDRSAGSAADELYLYSRFLDHVRCLDEIEGDGILRANQLPAWWLPSDLIRAENERFSERMDELSILLKDIRRMSDESRESFWHVHGDLEEDFATIRLVGLIARRSPDHQERSLDHVRLASICSPPEIDSEFSRCQSALARISHGLLDVDVLLEQERLEEAEVLMAWINAQAFRLIRRLASTPPRPLAVPGMRDGDAAIDPGMMEMMR